MKKTIIATILILSTLSLVANTLTGQLKGKIIQSENRAPLAYATVGIYQLDSTLVKGVITDINGSFVIENLPFGEYSLKVSFIGYKDVSMRIEVDNALIELEDIQVAEDTEMLNSAVVTARVPVIEQKLDMLVMNVSEAVSTQGSNAMEVLRKAPGVSIDPDGNITLNGSVVEVWIDGRPSHLSGKDLEALLSATDAGTIDKIEIIAHPSAKYDAAGSGGIVNIKTKKNFLKGFNGSISGSYGGMYFDQYIQKASGSVNLAYRSDKTNTFFTYSPRYSENSMQGDTKTLLGENYSQKLVSNTDYMFENMSQSFKLGNDWFINKKNIFGVILTSTLRDGKDYNYNDSFTNLYTNDVLTQSQQSDIDNSSGFDKYAANLNYTHIFDEKKGSEMTINADYSYYDIGNKSDQKNVFRNPLTSVALPNPIIFRANSGQRIDMYSVKLDYEQIVWKTGKIEVGGKWEMTNTDNNTLRENMIGDLWVKDDDLSNDFKYDEQIAAAYVSFAKMFGKKWTVKIGLRGEYTFSKGDWASATDPSKNYFNVFPTAYVGFVPSQKWRYSLSYTRRINRPRFSQLNPFRMYIDAASSMEGNPNLQPQFTDQVSIGVGFKSFVNLSAVYHYSDNLIMQDPDMSANDGSTIFRWSNFGTQQRAGLNLSISELPIFKWMVFNANLYGAYSTNTTKASDGKVFENNGFMNSLYGNLTFLLPKDWKIEFGAWYQGSLPWGYFRIQSQYAAFGGIKKNFWDNKASLALNINDIFRTQRSNLRLVDGAGTEYYAIDQKFNNQKVELSFTYRFGNVKPIKHRKVGDTDGASRVGDGGGIGK